MPKAFWPKLIAVVLAVAMVIALCGCQQHEDSSCKILCKSDEFDISLEDYTDLPNYVIENGNLKVYDEIKQEVTTITANKNNIPTILFAYIDVADKIQKISVSMKSKNSIFYNSEVTRKNDILEANNETIKFDERKFSDKKSKVQIAIPLFLSSRLHNYKIEDEINVQITVILKNNKKFEYSFKFNPNWSLQEQDTASKRWEKVFNLGTCYNLTGSPIEISSFYSDKNAVSDKNFIPAGSNLILSEKNNRIQGALLELLVYDRHPSKGECISKLKVNEAIRTPANGKIVFTSNEFFNAFRTLEENHNWNFKSCPISQNYVILKIKIIGVNQDPYYEYINIQWENTRCDSWNQILEETTEVETTEVEATEMEESIVSTDNSTTNADDSATEKNNDSSSFQNWFPDSKNLYS